MMSHFYIIGIHQQSSMIVYVSVFFVVLQIVHFRSFSHSSYMKLFHGVIYNEVQGKLIPV
jgi:hypothetical protein